MFVPCRYYNTPTGCRSGDHCRYSHAVHQVVVNSDSCRYFNSPSGCRYGNGCFYKHESNQTQQRQSIQPSKYQTKVPIISHDIDNKKPHIINTNIIINKEHKVIPEKDTHKYEKDIDDAKAMVFDLSKLNIDYIYNKKRQQNRQSIITEFYIPLKLDYIPITQLSQLETTKCAETFKLRGNKLYSNKKYVKAIKYYEKAITLLDCNYFQNDQKSDVDTNALLSILLSNTAQCWLNYYDKEPNILYLLSALNCVEMSLWSNSSNNKALYRKIKCLFRLGLTQTIAETFAECTNYNEVKQFSVMLMKERKKPKQIDIQIEKYTQILDELGIHCSFEELTKRTLNTEWNAVQWQYVLLSATELIRTSNKWSISGCILWLKELVNGISDDLMHYTLLPRNLYHKKQYEYDYCTKFKMYSLGFILVILSSKPKEIASYFVDVTESEYVSEDDWEHYADKINYIQMNRLWICDRFWSIIVENILSKQKWKHESVVTAVKEKTLIYVQINDMDQRYLNWKRFYDIHQLRTYEDQHNILPFDGRLKPFTKYDREKGNDYYLGDDDLLNIHAIATSMKRLDVIQEIEENVLHLILYRRGYRWLHEFAKYGCYKACQFIVSLGFDVNCMKRETPIDYALRHLITHKKSQKITIHTQLTDTQQINLQKVIRTLREIGGKRHCELSNQKGNVKETKLFNKIINGDIQNYFYSDNMSYNELKEKLILYDAQSNQKTHASPGSFDSFQINLAIKDFQQLKIPNHMIGKLINEGIRPWDYGGNKIEAKSDDDGDDYDYDYDFCF